MACAWFGIERRLQPFLYKNATFARFPISKWAAFAIQISTRIERLLRELFSIQFSTFGE